MTYRPISILRLFSFSVVIISIFVVRISKLSYENFDLGTRKVGYALL